MTIIPMMTLVARAERRKGEKDFVSTTWEMKCDFSPSKITKHFWRL